MDSGTNSAVYSEYDEGGLSMDEKEWYREKIIKMARETKDAIVLRFVYTIFHETIVRRKNNK